MTDSVKLWAFSDCRIVPGGWSVPGICALQAKVAAGAGIAPSRPLQAALPPAAHLARPARLGEEVEDVGAAEQPDHLAAADDGHTADPLSDQQPRRLVDAGLLG